MCGEQLVDIPSEHPCAPKSSEEMQSKKSNASLAKAGYPAEALQQPNNETSEGVQSKELRAPPAVALPAEVLPAEALPAVALPAEASEEVQPKELSASPAVASPAEAPSSASVAPSSSSASEDEVLTAQPPAADAKPIAKRRPSKINCISDVDKSRLESATSEDAFLTPDGEKAASSARKGLEESSSPNTPSSSVTPLTSKSHIDRWREVGETMIIFDWDDTLCPTTWIWEDPRLKWNEVAPCFSNPSMPAMPSEEGKSRAREATATAEGSDEVVSASSRESATGRKEPTMIELLQNHVRAVIQLLRLAASLGKVTIVTLAQVDWVTTSVRNFMPELAELLEELSIEVVYARQLLPERSIRRAQEEESDVTRVLKTKAMSRVIKKFYGTGTKSNERSWKNVLSIGDSAAERWALQDVILGRVQRDSSGAPKECRCKVLKLLSEPSLERLTAEVQVLLSWIPTVVMHDGDIDLDFGDMMDMDEDSPCSPVSGWGIPSRRAWRSDPDL